MPIDHSWHNDTAAAIDHFLSVKFFFDFLSGIYFGYTFTIDYNSAVSYRFFTRDHGQNGSSTDHYVCFLHLKFLFC